MCRFGEYLGIVFIIFITNMVVGCATPLVIDHDYDTTYDFTKLKTYDWLPTPPGSQVEDMVEKRLKQAVITQLGTKGYTQSSQSPDFMISLHGVVKTVDAGSVGIGTSIGVPVGSRGSVSVGLGKSQSRVKQEGTLKLNILDRQTNALIWEGSATATIQPKSTPEEQQQRINQVIAEMLKQFPPQKAKQ